MVCADWFVGAWPVVDSFCISLELERVRMSTARIHCRVDLVYMPQCIHLNRAYGRYLLYVKASAQHWVSASVWCNFAHAQIKVNLERKPMQSRLVESMPARFKAPHAQLTERALWPLAAGSTASDVHCSPARHGTYAAVLGCFVTSAASGYET